MNLALRNTVFNIILSLSSLTCMSQEWKLVKHADDIYVYNRPIKGSAYNAFKATMTVEATVDEMAYVLHNIDKFKDIFPDTEELRILERKGRQGHIQYSYTRFPWPAANRDGVFEMTFSRNSTTGALRVTGEALPDHLPERSGVVRIKQSHTIWEVVPIGKDKIEITYTVEAEPGGKVPAWIVNSAASQIPYDSFIKLREILLRQ